MQALANMLNTLLEDLLLITYACAMGGLVWSLLLLKPWRHHLPAESGLATHSLALLRWGALGMALVQMVKLVRHAWLLAEAFRRQPCDEGNRPQSSIGGLVISSFGATPVIRPRCRRRLKAPVQAES